MVEKKILKVLFLFNFIMLVSFQSSFADCSFSLGWEDWEPYQYQKSDKKPGGLDIELITAVMENANCRLSYIKLPWKRHLIDLNTVL